MSSSWDREVLSRLHVGSEDDAWWDELIQSGDRDRMVGAGLALLRRIERIDVDIEVEMRNVEEGLDESRRREVALLRSRSPIVRRYRSIRKQIEDPSLPAVDEGPTPMRRKLHDCKTRTRSVTTTLARLATAIVEHQERVLNPTDSDRALWSLLDTMTLDRSDDGAVGTLREVVEQRRKARSRRGQDDSVLSASHPGPDVVT